MSNYFRRRLESEKTMVEDTEMSDFRQITLGEQAEKAVNEYSLLLEHHLSEEKVLRTKQNKVETQLAQWLAKYDTDIGERQATKEELTEEYVNFYSLTNFSSSVLYAFFYFYFFVFLGEIACFSYFYGFPSFFSIFLLRNSFLICNGIHQLQRKFFLSTFHIFYFSFVFLKEHRRTLKLNQCRICCLSTFFTSLLFRCKATNRYFLTDLTQIKLDWKS